MKDVLEKQIKKNIHNIFNKSLLNIKYLNDDDIENINLEIMILYKSFNDLILEYQNEIMNLKKELSETKLESDNLASELLISETALNKITGGHAKEEMAKVTVNDIFFKH